MEVHKEKFFPSVCVLFFDILIKENTKANLALGKGQWIPA